MRQSAYRRSIHVVCLVSGLLSLSLFGSAFGDSNVGAMSQEAQRAEKRALIVIDDYIIGPEDILEISVWRNPDLSREVRVRPDGKVSLPLIGDVKAVGRTTSELRDDITQKLKSYKENPTVAIVVKEVNSYYFYVQGAVGKIGKLPLLSRTTLIQAITLAGGMAPDAVRSRITIFRLGMDSEAPQKLVVSYDDIILRGADNVELKPGDTIVVPSETMVLIP
ncbi:polysaccharide biosynthesis/export family protein [Nitrospira sp. T9]|uniref:polysaccharide biosynthesis/export family protein n=1 Tax=unclassified Nitrospira TaxID=2652172 RepID=UPI003F966830